MQFKKFNLVYLLNLGLALTFLANSLTAFLHPDDFKDLIGGSIIFGKIAENVPFFIVLIGINDLLVALLLIFKISTKIVANWASLWIFGVILVLLTQKDLSGSWLDALEHAGFLAVAIYLALSNNSKTAENQEVMKN